ncbi:hypothetical protein [Streptomyces sp. NPDC059209]
MRPGAAARRACRWTGYPSHDSSNAVLRAFVEVDHAATEPERLAARLTA